MVHVTEIQKEGKIIQNCGYGLSKLIIAKS